jgi:hypothetical protein
VSCLSSKRFFLRTLIISILLITGIAARAANENYLAYHNDILSCERLFLYDNDIKAALASYRRVFNHYKPMAKDCFIALQLAALDNNKEQAEYFLTEAFRSGVPIEAIHASMAVEALLQNEPSISNKVDELYKRYHAAFMRGVNNELRAKVIELKNADDSMKMRTQGMGKDDPERLLRKEAYDAQLAINTLEIARLIQEHGFLSDRLIGLMDYGLTSDGAERIECCYSLRSLADQLFYHDACCYFILEKELEMALANGELQPAMYASIYEWAYKDLREKRPELAICRTEGREQQKCFNICPVIRPWERNKDTAFVNKCRAEIGLASIEHQQKKKQYEERTGLKLFFGMFGIY